MRMPYRFVNVRACTAVALLAAFAALPQAQGPTSKLPPDQLRAGWTPLFDGQSLEGWRAYRQPDATNTRWAVTGDMLCVVPAAGDATRAARDIITTRAFDDFELTWEWRVAPGGNSGLKYLVLEDQNSAIGHEYQLIDDERHPDAKAGPKRQTAALYDVIAASNRPLRPAGQFNQSRIVVSGTSVEHWLNGARVLEYELESPALADAIAHSKFTPVARFGKRHTAHIVLQDHGDAVCYRNIAIRPGPERPSAK